jgi:hypothetical protein
MKEEKVSFGEVGDDSKYVEKEEKVAKLESYWRTSYVVERKNYNTLYWMWRKDTKKFGHFSIDKKPTPPIALEEQKERYLRRKWGEKVEEEVAEVSNKVDWNLIMSFHPIIKVRKICLATATLIERKATWTWNWNRERNGGLVSAVRNTERK